MASLPVYPGPAVGHYFAEIASTHARSRRRPRCRFSKWSRRSRAGDHEDGELHRFRRLTEAREAYEIDSLHERLTGGAGDRDLPDMILRKKHLERNGAHRHVGQPERARLIAEDDERSAQHDAAGVTE